MTAQQPDAAPPNIKKFLENSERSRRGSIVQIEQSLRGLRSGQVQAKNVERRIQRLEADLEALQSRETLIVPALVFPPGIGDIGRLPGIGGHVDRVLSDTSMVITCYFSDPVMITRDGRRMVQKVSRPVTFVVRGLATQNVHVGMDLELTQPFEVASTQEYRTASGVIRLPVVEPFNLRQAEPYREK